MSQGSIMKLGQRTEGGSDLQVTARRVTFPSLAGRRLVGTLHEPAGWVENPERKAPAIILCHGMESTREGYKHVALAERFAQGGFECLRFDFGFVGESEGDFADLTITGELEDALGALQFMSGRGASQIALVGSSLGGTVAVLAAAKSSQVRALATIAAVSRPQALLGRLGRGELERWRQRGFRDFGGKPLKVSFVDDAEQIDVLAAAAQVSCPVLVTHGVEDQVVPPEDAAALAEAVGANATLELFPQADHRFSDPGQLESLLGRIVDWMEPRLSQEGC